MNLVLDSAHEQNIQKMLGKRTIIFAKTATIFEGPRFTLSPLIASVSFRMPEPFFALFRNDEERDLAFCFYGCILQQHAIFTPAVNVADRSD